MMGGGVPESWVGSTEPLLQLLLLLLGFSVLLLLGPTQGPVYT